MPCYITNLTWSGPVVLHWNQMSPLCLWSQLLWMHVALWEKKESQRGRPSETISLQTSNQNITSFLQKLTKLCTPEFQLLFLARICYCFACKKVGSIQLQTYHHHFVSWRQNIYLNQVLLLLQCPGMNLLVLGQIIHLCFMTDREK